MSKADNLRVVWNELLKGGLTPVQAAGVVGRWQQESGPGLNPTIIGDRSIPGGSVGIGQWNRQRLQNLKKFGGNNWTDPAVQARFFFQEGAGPESRAFQMLKKADTIEEASQAMMGYERPAGFTWDNPAGGHGYGNTVKNAQKLLGMNLGGTSGAGAMPMDLAGIGSPDRFILQPPLSLAGIGSPNMYPTDGGSGATGIADASGVSSPASAMPAANPLSALLKGIGDTATATVGNQKPMQPPQIGSIDNGSDAARMSAAAQLMQTILNARKRAPGLNLMG